MPGLLRCPDMFSPAYSNSTAAQVAKPKQRHEQPAVEGCATFTEGFSYWLKSDGATDLCLI